MKNGESVSAWERWTWKRCCNQILSLKNRLGYDESLWILGFQLLDDGRLQDPFHDVVVFNPTCASPATLIIAQYSAIPEMYCILSTYAGASETPLTGKPISLMELDPVKRLELPGEECTFLLGYCEQDWTVLHDTEVPFFGERAARGDIAFVVWPLPMVPITLTLWRGEGELPNSGSLHFDRSATHYLPGLLAELAWLTVWRLRNILDTEERWGYRRLST